MSHDTKNVKMHSRSILTIALVGVAASVGLAAAKPSDECNRMEDACILEGDAGKQAKLCKAFHDKCDSLGEKIDRLTDPPKKKDADKGDKKKSGGKKAGSGGGHFEVTYRSAGSGNGKIIWVVMPDGSTVPVKQGVPGGAFLTKMIDGKPYSVEFIKVVNGVSYNVADPAYEAALAAKQKRVDGAVSGVPTRSPAGKLPRDGGLLAGGATPPSGKTYTNAGNASNASAIPAMNPGAPSGASVTPGTVSGTAPNTSSKTVPGLSGTTSRKFP